MRILSILVTICLLCSWHCFAAISGGIFETGFPADNCEWGFGFQIHSDKTQNVKIWLFLEFPGDVIYIADHGFDYTPQQQEYGTFYLESGEVISQQVLAFTWPVQALPEFYHFWIWMIAEGSAGDDLKRQTRGVTYWGDYYNCSFPTYPPTNTPLPTSTPAPTRTPTPTPMKTSTPTPSPSISPTPTPSAMARVPKWYQP